MKTLTDSLFESLWNIQSEMQMKNLGVELASTPHIGFIDKNIEKVRDWLVRSYGIQPIGRVSAATTLRSDYKYIILPKNTDKLFFRLIDPSTHKVYEIRREKYQIMRSIMLYNDNEKWSSNNDRVLYMFPKNKPMVEKFVQGFISTMEEMTD